MRDTVSGFDAESPTIQSRLIERNRLAFAFLSRMPIVPGHLLICPVRVVQTCEDLLWAEWQAILELRRRACQALRKTFDAEGFNFAWNMGEVAGQTVPHFHLHVVPRKAGDTGVVQYDPRVFLYRPGGREVSAEQELAQVAALVRNNLCAVADFK